MSDLSRVLLTDYEETYCEMCGRTLECDEYGDMPDRCPDCDRQLDYSIFSPGTEQREAKPWQE